jgi:erythromycin esterase
MSTSRSSNSCLRLVAPLAALACTSAPTAALAGAHGDAVGPGLYALAGADPTLPDADLRPLDDIVGNARMVGLGEPIHTSGGFYRMKHRIFRYLVEEQGFRVLGWESPFYRVDRASRYVDTCAGTPEDAVKGLFTNFQSTETADLLRWMCAWNASHPEEKDRVHLYGFDIQREAKAHADALVAFLADAGVPDDDPWIDGVRACDGVVTTYWPAAAFPEEQYDTCQGALAEIAAFFDANEHHLEQQTSPEALGWARVHVVAQQAWQEMIFSIADDFTRAAGARDRGMAHLAQAVAALRFPHDRVALWAHNGHVSQDGTVSIQLDTMGTHLAESLGSKYVTLAMTAHEVDANWPAQGYCGPVESSGTRPVEDVLHAVGRNALLVDLRPRGAHPTFLDPAASYSIGDFYEAPLAPSYDALVYLDVSPMMHSLAWPMCQ